MALQSQWLLYELLGVAENSKVHSTKLCKALKALYDQKDLQAQFKHGKPTSLQDELDKYDLGLYNSSFDAHGGEAEGQWIAEYQRAQITLQKGSDHAWDPSGQSSTSSRVLHLRLICSWSRDGLMAQTDTHPGPADLGVAVFRTALKRGRTPRMHLGLAFKLCSPNVQEESSQVKAKAKAKTNPKNIRNLRRRQ